MNGASQEMPLNPFDTTSTGKKNPFQGEGGEFDGLLVQELATVTGDGPSPASAAALPQQPPPVWKWFRFIWKTLTWTVCTLLAYFILMGLNYYGIWDPCQFKFSYRRQCTVDFYGSEKLLSYTEYEEDFFCLIPGIGFHQEEKGWNLDAKCK